MRKLWNKLKSRLAWTAGVIIAQFGLIAVLVLMACLAIVYAFNSIGENYWIAGILIIITISTLVNLFTIIHINRTPWIDASFRYAWASCVILLPIAGTIIYALCHRRKPLSFWKKITANPAIVETELHCEEHTTARSNLKADSRLAWNQSTYIENYGFGALYDNSKTTYFDDGLKNFEEMLLQIKKAKKYIFMEYFIIAKGSMLTELEEALKEKINEGVDVRLIYDDTGSINRVPLRYYRHLRSIGVKTHRFNIVKPYISNDNINTRNHRKVCIIDGKVAFTGGINIADEYINRIDRFGHWKDTGVMIEGQAAYAFTVLFISMWNIIAKTNDDYHDYFPEDVEIFENVGYVNPFCDFPGDDDFVGENIYLNLISNAERTIHIMSPYLVIDDRLKGALINAAKQGIEVSLIMPGTPDKKSAYAVAQSYWPELVNAGVNIHLYQPGFIHAKSMVVDGIVGVIGTVNLDFRSLYFHLECGIWMHKTPILNDIEKDFEETLKVCRKLGPQDVKYKFHKKIWLAIMRIATVLF